MCLSEGDFCGHFNCRFFSLSPRRPPLCQRFVVGGKVPDNVAGTLAAILVQLFTQIVCAMEESGPKFTQPPPCQQCTFCFCVRMKLCSRGKSKKSVCVCECFSVSVTVKREVGLG